MRNIRLLREFISLSLNEGMVPGSGDKKTDSSGGSGEDEAADETGTQSDASGHPAFEDEAIRNKIASDLTDFLTGNIKSKIANVADDINDASWFEGDASSDLLNLLEEAAKWDAKMPEDSMYPLALSYVVLAVDQGSDTYLNNVLGWFSEKWNKNVTINENILRNTSKQKLNELEPVSTGLAAWWLSTVGWGGTIAMLTALGLIGNEAVADGSLSFGEIQKLSSLKDRIVVSFKSVAEYADRNKMGALTTPLNTIANHILNNKYTKADATALLNKIQTARNTAFSTV